MTKRKKARRMRDAEPPPSAAAGDGGSVCFGGGGGGDGDGDGEDRLTELPDTLRLYILSLLPLKSAVRTGALSTRWRGLWRLRWPHDASLNLAAGDLSGVGGDDEEEAAEAFVARVDEVLRCRGRRRLDALRIAFRAGFDRAGDVRRWLDYAAACSVEDLHLDLCPPAAAGASAGSRRRNRRWERNQRNVPAAAAAYFDFVCDSPLLARVTLSGFHLASPASGFRRLVSLEILNLHGIQITDAALRRIVLACPRLRSLDIRSCRGLRRIVIPMEGAQLKSLTLVDCPKAAELKVEAPNLRSFKFGGVFLTHYCFSRGFLADHRDAAAGLEDVYLSSSGLGSGLPRSNCWAALGQLPNVKVLTLCSFALQYVVASGADEAGQFRNFGRLKELQLLMVMMADSNLTDIYTFFRLCRCPCLERLLIELPTNMREPLMENFLEVAAEEPPEIGFENLKTVKMNSFKGHDNEMELVRFLLAKAGCLDTLVIVAPRKLMEEEYSRNVVDDMLQFIRMELSLMTKASPHAQIILSESNDNQFRPIHSEIHCKL